jgi:hypothetical protein
MCFEVVNKILFKIFLAYVIKFLFCGQIFEEYSYNNLIKISSVGVELLQVDSRVNTHRQDEANAHILKLCQQA